MSRSRRAASVAFATLAAILTATSSGCGYSFGHSGGGGVRTVAIEIAGNDTFWQRREISLTRAVATILPRHTDYVVTGHDRADAVLRVRIETLDPRTLVVGATPLVEGALRYRVHVQLVDRRTGVVHRDRVVLDQAEYRTSIGEGVASAAREADDDLARKIALALEDPF